MFSVSKGLKFLSIGWLLLTTRIGLATSGSFCKESGSGFADFICGDMPQDYQPCFKDFELASGQATTATMLWLLGEYHDQRNTTESCLEKLTANVKEHIVYVENTESGKEVPCKKAELNEKKGRKCIGWDNMTAKAKIEKLPLVGHGFYSGMLKNIQNSLKTIAENDFDEILLKNLKKYQQIEKHDETLTGFKLREIRAQMRIWDFLLKQRSEGYSYKDIFEKDMCESLYEISQEELELYKEYQKARSVALVHTLSKTPHSIFAVSVSGVSHAEVTDPDDVAAAKYVQAELQKGKHQNYYAILAMRNA